MTDASMLFQQSLADWGLSLYATLTPAQCREAIGIGPPSEVTEGGRLLVLGNGGGRFWTRLKAHAWHSDEPVDDFTQVVVNAEIDCHLGAVARQWLYPRGAQVNLLALGRSLGWTHSSPLGMGIHPEWGLWSAFRGVLWVAYPLAEVQQGGDPSHPCLSCESLDCIRTCPAEALATDQWPDLCRCATYRYRTDSSCADRCVARMACPVQAEQQYPLAQIQHHYVRSLEGDMLRQYALRSEPSSSADDQ